MQVGNPPLNAPRSCGTSSFLPTWAKGFPYIYMESPSCEPRLVQRWRRRHIGWRRRRIGWRDGRGQCIARGPPPDADLPVGRDHAEIIVLMQRWPAPFRAQVPVAARHHHRAELGGPSHVPDERGHQVAIREAIRWLSAPRRAGRTLARTGGTRLGLCVHAGARAARARPQTCQPALAPRPVAVRDAL